LSGYGKIAERTVLDQPAVGAVTATPHDQRHNQALHSDRGLTSVLYQRLSRVRAQAPAPFSAPPRSAKVDVPRRVNASIVRQTGSV
jgi:hypothetical protein